MKSEVVLLGLTCACMNYSTRKACLLGESGSMPQENFGFQSFYVICDPIF